MNRNYDKHIRLTKEEREDWQRKAAMTGLSVSPLVRMLMNGYAPKEKPDERFYETMRELSAVGDSINRLADKANSLGVIDAPMLRREAERWHKFQADIECEFLRPEKMNLKWR